jgi:hypothetical protein
MTDAATQQHNALVKQFMRTILAEAIRQGGGLGQIMLLVESCAFGALLTNERIFGVNRRASIELMEALTGRVLERLAKEPVGGRLRD